MTKYSSSVLWALVISILLCLSARAQQPPNGSGTVTSVGIITPPWQTVTPGTISSQGIFQFGTAPQSQGKFLASPSFGAGTLSPRVITPSDLPLGSNAAPGALQCGSGTFCSGGVISAIGGGGGSGNVSGPPNTTSGYVPTWTDSSGMFLGQGMPIGTTGNSTLVQTDTSGLIRAPINTTNGTFGGLTVTGSFTAPGLVSAAALSPGAAISNIGNFSTGQFLGYSGAGAGLGTPVTIQAGSNVTFPCVGTVCTINSTAQNNGITGPGASTVGFVPLWSNTIGATLSSGLPVGTSGVSTIIQSDNNGHIANGLISGLPNANLANSQITLGSSPPVPLGGSISNISGLTLGAPTITVGGDTTGDIYYRGPSGSLSRLGLCGSGQFLTSSGSQPSCSTTVTSVGLTAPSWLTTGAPVTTSGNLSLTSTTQSANLVLASPSGSPGVLAPRALTTTDIPAIPISSGVSGLGSGVSTALGIGIGSGGSVLVNGGALGTPSSVNLTNATGLPFATGLTGTLLPAQLPALSGAITSTAGSNQTSFQSLNNAQFIGYGSGSGSGAGQAVTIQSGAGASFNCTGQVCTIGATGTGGISGPASVTTAFVPQWISNSSLSSGLPVVTTSTANALVETGSGGTIATNFLAPGAALSNLGTISNAQFIGYGGGTGSGPAQTVAITSGTGANFVCTPGSPQTCTITATGTGNTLSSPTSTVTLGGGPTASTVDLNLAHPNTWTAAQSFNSGSFVLNGSNSGALTIQPAASAGTGSVFTLPAGTTNFSATGGASQVVRQQSLGAPLTVSQLAASDLTNTTTGSGQVVLSSSPALTTPDLGIPSHVVLTNATSLPLSTGITGFGTGVATALGVNIGSAGAPVLFNGTLGTPTSATLTNATGLPISSGVSGLGTNVAAALGAAIGSSGAFVVNGGALGTPTSGTLTNAIGLPLSTGITGFGANVATALGVALGNPGAFVTNGGALGTPASANLANATGLPFTGLTGTLQQSQFPGLTGAVTASPGSTSTSFQTVNNAQFLGYGSGSGSGSAQAVTITSGTGASFNCTNQVCTIGATGTGGISGPGTTTVTFVPQWASGTGNSLGTGLPVAAAPSANALVETGAGGTIANSFLASGAALANIGTVPNSQFIGYGAGSGSGAAQSVAITSGAGAGFTCAAGTPQTCTITATGTGNALTSPNSTVTLGGTSTASTIDINAAHSNTWTAAQAFGSGDLVLNGATGGSLTIQPASSAGAGSVLTLPGGSTNFAATGGASQVVRQQTLGGAFTVSQLAPSDLSGGPPTGSGAVVLATSPVLTTPNLGIPSAATLTNATGLPIATGVSGLGTGIATSLGINVGSAGAPVVFNGALGTPSSATLTNAIGLPISTGVSGLGLNVATALGNPVGSAGSIVTNGGALGTPSSGVLSNAIGLPVSTGISGLGLNVATALTVGVGSPGAFVTNGGALGTPSSANLANATGLPFSTGLTGTLLSAQLPALTGAVTSTAGSNQTSFESVNNSQFIGYGSGSGSGSAQAVTIQANNGASFSCVSQVCTVTATGTGIAGPGSSTIAYVPQWSTAGGNSLSPGLPVATTATANSLVETGAGGTIANTFLSSGAAAANLGAAGGALTGTYPSPSLASGAAAANVGTLSQDLFGSLPNPKVVGLQGVPVSATTPTANQIMTYNGSAWTPAAAPISGINALTQDVQASGTGSQAAKVVGIQGTPVTGATPLNGQVLEYNGTAYAPADEPAPGITQLNGAVTTPAGSGPQTATIAPTGVIAGSYTVTGSSGASFDCLTIAASGQVTGMTPGACGGATYLLINTGGGKLLLNSGGAILTNGS